MNGREVKRLGDEAADVRRTIAQRQRLECWKTANRRRRGTYWWGWRGSTAPNNLGALTTA